MAERTDGAQNDTRPRGKRPCAVWVTPEEKAGIERLAATTGLSVSRYLRTLGLGYEPKSILDADHVLGLLKVAGDLGRLGGLLKLWLAERPGEGASVDDVRYLLRSMSELRDKIADKVVSIEVRR